MLHSCSAEPYAVTAAGTSNAVVADIKRDVVVMLVGGGIRHGMLTGCGCISTAAVVYLLAMKDA